MLATAFHPEITGDMRVHRLFVDIVMARLIGRAGDQLVAQDLPVAPRGSGSVRNSPMSALCGQPAAAPLASTASSTAPHC
jgi:hypothetical protein